MMNEKGEMNERHDTTLEPRLPQGLEKALHERANGASEMPWLSHRVMAQVNYHEQARNWLKLHPQGLLAGRVSLRHRVGALAGSFNGPAWRIAGVAVLTTLLGYALFSVWPLPDMLQTAPVVKQWGGVSVVAAVTLGLSSALAMCWPSLKSNFIGL